MAASNLQAGEVIDVRPFGPGFAGAKSSILLKTDALQLVRLVIPQGQEIPSHSARGEITVHCLEGRVAFTTNGVTYELGAGQLLHLPGEQIHSVLGLEDASLLVTKTAPRNANPEESPARP